MFTWIMSCRVIARRLEEFVLGQLVEVACEAGLTRLRGRYVPTKKNGMVAEHYGKLGFHQVEAAPDGNTTWDLGISKYAKPSVPIKKKTK